jgi:autotransporter-associated beta strand protein
MLNSRRSWKKLLARIGSRARKLAKPPNTPKRSRNLQFESLEIRRCLAAVGVEASNLNLWINQTSTLTISRTGPTSSALDVYYVLTGTATGPGQSAEYSLTADPSVSLALPFAGADGSLEIPAGAGSAVVNIVANDVPPSGATVDFDLAAPGGAEDSLASSSVATVVLGAGPAVEITPAQQWLANPAGIATATISRDGPTTSPLTVDFALQGIANGASYSMWPDRANSTDAFSAPAGSNPGAITLPIGQSAAMVDLLVGGVSSTAAYLSLAEPAGAGYVPDRASVAGIVFGGAPTVEVSPSEASLLIAGQAAPVTITRQGDTSAPLTVDFSVGGTAPSGDYSLYPAAGEAFSSPFPGADGAVVIPAGQSAAIVNIYANDVPSPGATVDFDLAAPGSAYYALDANSTATVVLGSGQAVEVSPANQLLTDASSPAAVTITREGDDSDPLTVDFSVDNITSSGDYYVAPDPTNSDDAFCAPSGSNPCSITIPAGTSSAIVDLSATGVSSATLDLSLVWSSGARYALDTASVAEVVLGGAPVVQVSPAEQWVDDIENSVSYGPVTISRQGNDSAPLTFDFSIDGNNGDSSGNYWVTLDSTNSGDAFGTPSDSGPDWVTIPSGNSSAIVDIWGSESYGTIDLVLSQPSDNSYVLDNNSLAEVVLGGTSGGSGGGSGGTPVVEVSPGEQWQNAPNGDYTAPVTISLDGGATGPLTVDFNVSLSGDAGDYYVSAASGVSFSPPASGEPGWVTIPSGASSVIMDIDGTGASSGSVKLSLIAAGDGSYSLDNDSMASVSVGYFAPCAPFVDVSPGEQWLNSPCASAAVTISLDDGASGPLTVDFSLGGTATSGDYSIWPADTGVSFGAPYGNSYGWVDVPSGESSVTLDVSANTFSGETVDLSLAQYNDYSYSRDEDSLAEVVLGSNSGGGSGGTGGAAGTPVVEVSPDEQWQSAPSGYLAAPVTITRSGDTADPLTVDFSLDASGSIGDFYMSGDSVSCSVASDGSGWVTIPASQSSAIIDLESDDAYSGTLDLSLLPPGNGSYTIDNDSAADVFVGNSGCFPTVEVTPGEQWLSGSSTPATVTISLDGDATGLLTVYFDMAETGGGDYSVWAADSGDSFSAPAGDSAGWITIPCGQNSATLDVTAGDVSSATVDLSLIQPGNGSYSTDYDSTGVMFFGDSGIGPTVEVSPGEQVLASSGAFAPVTFVRGGDTSEPLTVDFSAAGNSNDYYLSACGYSFSAPAASTPGSLTIPAGQSSATVNIYADSIPSGDPTVELLLVSPGDNSYFLDGASTADVVLSSTPDIELYWNAASNAGNPNWAAGIWNEGATNGPTTGWIPNAEANFPSGTTTVDVSSAVSVGSIDFLAGGATIAATGPAGTLSLTGGTITASGTDTISAAIVSGSVTKQGNGELAFSGDNSYGGGTTVVSGTLQAGSPPAFGTGPLVVNGGLVDLNGESVTVSGLTSQPGSGGTVTNNSSTPAVLNVGGAPAQDFFYGSISGAAGPVSLNLLTPASGGSVYALYLYGSDS